MGTSLTRRRWFAHLLIAVCAVLLFHAVSMASGKVADNRGLGWDGESYAAMVRGALADGRAHPQSRPLLVLVTRIPYWLGVDIVRSFHLLNYGYAFALALVLSLLLERYGAAPHVRAAVVANVALCIATSKMFAFYPVLVDLGALALTTVAFYLAGGDRKWLTGVACVLAVASREFGAAAVLYGIHRSLRLRRGWVETTLVYLPSVVTIVLIRRWVSATHAGDGTPGVFGLSEALDNLHFWRTPAFVATFAYFVVSVFGGVSALLIVRGGWCLSRLRAEPELATFLALIVGLSAVGNLDIWRYLAFALPVAIVLIAQYWNGLDANVTRRLLIVMTLFTVLTQRPFEYMDVERYFRDWFPLYQYFGQSPVRSDDFLAVWSIRMASVLLLTVALYLTVRRGTGARTGNKAAASPS